MGRIRLAHWATLVLVCGGVACGAQTRFGTYTGVLGQALTPHHPHGLSDASARVTIPVRGGDRVQRHDADLLVIAQDEGGVSFATTLPTPHGAPTPVDEGVALLQRHAEILRGFESIDVLRQNVPWEPGPARDLAHAARRLHARLVRHPDVWIGLDRAEQGRRALVVHVVRFAGAGDVVVYGRLSAPERADTQRRFRAFLPGDAPERRLCEAVRTEELAERRPALAVFLSRSGADLEPPQGYARKQDWLTGGPCLNAVFRWYWRCPEDYSALLSLAATASDPRVVLEHLVACRAKGRERELRRRLSGQR